MENNLISPCMKTYMINAMIMICEFDVTAIQELGIRAHFHRETLGYLNYAIKSLVHDYSEYMQYPHKPTRL